MQNEIKFFERLVNKLITEEQEDPVVKPLDPSSLNAKFDLEFKDEGLSDSDWEKLIEDVALNTPRTASNLFFNQLYGGRQPKAVLGDLLAVVLNNSMYTYKVAGPQVGIEKAIMHKVCQLVGYEHGDGTIAPGGSLSNLMAMLMARDAKAKDIKHKGGHGNLVMYTSAESHYSIPKNAAFIGIGTDAVRKIGTDAMGKMDVDQLRSQITADKAAGLIPFMVNATAGTTVLGAFDDVTRIADVCDAFDMWLHVDGAYCGAVIYSEHYKPLIGAIERSDSFSMNAHKMLGTPLTCSIVVTKHRSALYDSFSMEADYLYQTDVDDYNLGKISLQCGRRNDALKLWTLWKALGNKGLEKLVDHQFHLADAARKYIQNHPDYTLYSHPNSISVCFNYKGHDPKELCTKLYTQAASLVGYGKFRNDEFIRFITINANNKEEDILNFFKVLEEIAG